MDYRLVLSVLLVTLSWSFMGCYAQSNSTATPTVGGNETMGANGTAAPSVAANGTAAPSVAANVTAAPSVAANVTAAPSVAANGTTTPSVGGNGTTVAGNTTTTAAATATTISVGPLTDTFTTTDCGSKKLCVAEPKTCDPSTGNQCYYISAKQQSGQVYGFELSGQSDGYIAAGLATSSNQADNHQAYICAKSNSVVRFFTGTLTNFIVNLTSLDASNVKGSINSNKIQCTFAATLPNTTTRAAGYSLSVSSGSYDPATGAFGTASYKIQTPVVNLSDPNTTISNLVNGTNSTNGAYPVVHQQSVMMPALLLIVTILAFTTQ